MPRPFPLLLVSLLSLATFHSSLAAEAGGTYTTDTVLVNGDTWTTSMTINSGATVSIPNLATVIYGAADNLTHTGNGTLRIDEGGTLFLDTKNSGDNMVLTGTLSVLNEGTLQIDAGTDMQLSSNGSSFTNNGLILKTAGSDGGSNDPAYIYPGTSSTGGKFTNNGDITVQAGHLNISGSQSAGNAASSTGGIFTTSGTGILSFSGGWSLLRGTSDMSAGGSVELSNENPASTTGTFFVAMAPTTILDVDGDGLLWKTGKLNTNGNVIENQGLLRLQGSGASLSGTAGLFLNAAGATFRMESGDLTVNTVTLRNEGTMSLNGATPTTTITLSGTGLLENAVGGIFDLTSGTLTSSLAISNAGTMTNAGATLNTNAAFTNTGTFNQTAGTWNLTAAATTTNSSTGTLNLKGTTITITGTTLTNDGTTAFITQDGNVTLQGTGTFLNNGTFNHLYGGSNDNLVLGGSITFQNEGTFDFQNRGDLQIVNTAKFVNNGLVQKTVGGSDATFIYGSAGFTAGAGSQILSKAGTLRVATGGTSDATALWTADGGHLDIAGTWTGTIAGSSGNSGRVRITNSMNAAVASDLTVGTGGLTLDIEGDGLFWDQRDILTAGNTLTNEGIFTITTGDLKHLTGGGELLNGPGGTLNHASGTVTLADDTVVRNQGAMNISAGAGTSGYEGTGAVVNDATGTITHTSGTLSFAGATELQNDGTYNWTAGTITLNTGAALENNGLFNINTTGSHAFVTDGTGTFTNNATGTMDWTAGGALNLGTGVTLTNNGTFNVTGSGDRSIGGAGTFINNGTFNNLVTVTSDNLAGTTSGGSFVNNGDFNFVGVQDFQLTGGYTFTNNGTITKTALNNSSDPAQFFTFDTASTTETAGTFDNQGTVRVEGGVFRVTAAVNGTFLNLNLVQNDGAGTLTGGTWVADSTATTVVTFSTIDLSVFGATSGITTIGENAVVDLIGSGANLTQLNSLSSVAGEFYVSSGKNFNASASSAFTVATTGNIGGNGTFSDAVTVNGAVTPGAERGTQNGKLTFASGVTFNAGSSITLQLTSPTGTVPLDGSVTTANISSYINGLGDLDPTTEHDAIDANGTLVLNPDMTISVVSNGAAFTFGQYFDLFDWTTALTGVSTQEEVDAILDLPELGEGHEWKTDLFLTQGIVYVVPEPSRALLMLGGMVLLTMRRRRK